MNGTFAYTTLVRKGMFQKGVFRMYKPVLAFLCAASIIAPLSAQAGEVRNREIRQEHRIYQGVRNDTLSPREYATLQRQEYRLNEQRNDFLHDGDGRDGLTHAQYRQLNREENRLSHNIYRAKHDGPGH
jgi:hypothetical protein